MIIYIYFHVIPTFILSNEIRYRRLDDTHLCNGPRLPCAKKVIVGEVQGLDMVVAANALQPRETQKINRHV